MAFSSFTECAILLHIIERHPCSETGEPMKRIFIQDHKPIPFLFRQTTEDFIVDEIPLTENSDRGNYFIAKIQKQNLSTMEMLTILEEATHCDHIGYAGLKDKAATTTQYISLPLKFSKALKQLKHPQIQIVEGFRSPKKLSLGDLKGNRFFIRLKEVSPKSAQHLKELLDEIMRYGMPNYFGYQRFGRDSANYEKAQEIAHGEEELRDKKMQRLLTNAYQSYLFNDWLVKRIALSKEIAIASEQTLSERYGLSELQVQQLKNQPGIFRVIPGDIMLDHQSRKWVNVTDLQEIRKPYKERKLSPTGLMSGRKAWRAKAMAATIEKDFDDMLVLAAGERRPAWIYPMEIRSKYKPEEKFFELSFTLPKGSYATVLLENLANRDLSPAERGASKPSAF